MRHFNQDQIEEILSAATFFTLLPANCIDMNRMVQPDCGTPGCVGGWLGVRYNLPVSEYPDSYYYESMHIFAQRIGFAHVKCFLDWAHDNPQVWGNNEGGCMLTHTGAWVDVGQKITPERVAEHLRGLASRIQAAQGDAQ